MSADTTTHLSPWTCLDALSDHPRYGEVVRCLHPSMAGVHPILPDVTEWGVIEIATYVAIVGGRELWLVPSSLSRALAVREHVGRWAQACGFTLRRVVWQSGCMALRFVEVAK